MSSGSMQSTSGQDEVTSQTTVTYSERPEESSAQGAAKRSFRYSGGSFHPYFTTTSARTPIGVNRVAEARFEDLQIPRSMHSGNMERNAERQLPPPPSANIYQRSGTPMNVRWYSTPSLWDKQSQPTMQGGAGSGRMDKGSPQTQSPVSPEEQLPQASMLPPPESTSSKSLTENSLVDEASEPMIASGKPRHPPCVMCGTKESPEWRRGPRGPKTLCNACGLRYSRQQRRAEAGLAGLGSSERSQSESSSARRLSTDTSASTQSRGGYASVSSSGTNRVEQMDSGTDLSKPTGPYSREQPSYHYGSEEMMTPYYILQTSQGKPPGGFVPAGSVHPSVAAHGSRMLATNDGRMYADMESLGMVSNVSGEVGHPPYMYSHVGHGDMDSHVPRACDCGSSEGGSNGIYVLAPMQDQMEVSQTDDMRFKAMNLMRTEYPGRSLVGPAVSVAGLDGRGF
ncbi:hypothetical protein BJ742DRAFT_295843 [Cladochytrium replicatum]|nr:hypothetical protein BJ742DRAFT_295843 [Cladochytrium replicatum]